MYDVFDDFGDFDGFDDGGGFDDDPFEEEPIIPEDMDMEPEFDDTAEGACPEDTEDDWISWEEASIVGFGFGFEHSKNERRKRRQDRGDNYMP